MNSLEVVFLTIIITLTFNANFVKGIRVVSNDEILLEKQRESELLPIEIINPWEILRPDLNKEDITQKNDIEENISQNGLEDIQRKENVNIFTFNSKGKRRHPRQTNSGYPTPNNYFNTRVANASLPYGSYNSSNSAINNYRSYTHYPPQNPTQNHYNQGLYYSSTPIYNPVSSKPPYQMPPINNQFPYSGPNVDRHNNNPQLNFQPTYPFHGRNNSQNSFGSSSGIHTNQRYPNQYPNNYGNGYSNYPNYPRVNNTSNTFGLQGNNINRNNPNYDPLGGLILNGNPSIQIRNSSNYSQYNVNNTHSGTVNLQGYPNYNPVPNSYGNGSTNQYNINNFPQMVTKSYSFGQNGTYQGYPNYNSGITLNSNQPPKQQNIFNSYPYGVDNSRLFGQNGVNTNQGFPKNNQNSNYNPSTNQLNNYNIHGQGFNASKGYVNQYSSKNPPQGLNGNPQYYNSGNGQIGNNNPHLPQYSVNNPIYPKTYPGSEPHYFFRPQHNNTPISYDPNKVPPHRFSY